jgi:hypothetical protein
MKAGAVDLIQTPFSDETNLAVIHSALLGRESRTRTAVDDDWLSQNFMIYMRVSQSIRNRPLQHEAVLVFLHDLHSVPRRPDMGPLSTRAAKALQQMTSQKNFVISF